MFSQLLEQFTVWLDSLTARGNIAITLAVIGVVAVLSGLLLVAALRLLRALLPSLVLAVAVALCWYAGLLNQWLLSLGL